MLWTDLAKAFSVLFRLKKIKKKRVNNKIGKHQLGKQTTHSNNTKTQMWAYIVYTCIFYSIRNNDLLPFCNNRGTINLHTCMNKVIFTDVLSRKLSLTYEHIALNFELIVVCTYV